MKIAFRADNDLDRDIVRRLLRLQPLIDFEAVLSTIWTMGRFSGLPMTKAACWLTRDISTIPPLFAQLRSRRPLCGVIVVRQDFPIGQAIERLILVWSLTEADEWLNRICYLPTLAEFVT